MNKYLASALIVSAVIVGMGLGYVLTPEYGRSMREGELHAKDLGKADRNLDLRFLNGLIAHHKSAIHLLNQVKKNSQRAELLGLADIVIPADEAEIGQLMTWRKSWYGQSGEIKRYAQSNLGGADEQFDLRFLNAMIVHHEEAIATMKEVQTKSSRQEVVALAIKAEAGLTDNVKTFKEWRLNWYNIQ